MVSNFILKLQNQYCTTSIENRGFQETNKLVQTFFAIAATQVVHHVNAVIFDIAPATVLVKLWIPKLNGIFPDVLAGIDTG